VGASPAAGTAPDGSLKPERSSPTFERDVRRMFATITDRYDAFNHVATFGQDLLWRPWALWELERFASGPIRRLLDVGCGTGALARRFASRYPSAEVVAVDFTSSMVGKARSLGGRFGPRSTFAVSDITHLPFADAAFDVAGSAFVARNLSDLSAAFRELRRVLRDGGTLLTLEVSEPASPSVRSLFHSHFDRVVPMLGRAFDREGPYSYLSESLRHFPGRERLLALLADAGFPRSRAVPLSLGVVTAYLAQASSRAAPRA
jgi:demethylmenaquinone methyltransferase / 2-methoxy-6-polyprenyl-1,4-benzoquinol methylase